MVTLDEAVVVRYEKEGHRFEILADPEAVLALREGKKVNIKEALAVEEIFKDARKAERASEEALIKVFGTTDVQAIAEKIMKEGEFRPTVEQRRRMLERIRKQIIEIIAKNSVDPRTGLPHPRERIERALEEARVKIELKPPMQQIERIVKALRPVLPLRFGTIKLLVKIPPAYTARAYGKIKGLGRLLREEWGNDGSLVVKLEVPSGEKVDVIEAISKITNGEAEVKEV